MVFNSNGIFYLLHSVPKFPRDPNISSSNFGFPLSGKINGQSFVCASLPFNNHGIDNLNSLLNAISSPNLLIYSSKLLADLANSLGTRLMNMYKSGPQRISLNSQLNGLKLFKPLVHVFTGLDLISDFFQKNIMISSPIHRWRAPTFFPIRFGEKYINIFAVNHMIKELAVDGIQHIANLYWTSLAIHSWVDKKVKKWPSSRYGKYSAENIVFIELLKKKCLSNNTHDSKWAISQDVNITITCIKDICRSQSLMAKGGIFICISDTKIHSYFTHHFHIKLKLCHKNF